MTHADPGDGAVLEQARTAELNRPASGMNQIAVTAADFERREPGPVFDRRGRCERGIGPILEAVIAFQPGHPGGKPALAKDRASPDRPGILEGGGKHAGRVSATGGQRQRPVASRAAKAMIEGQTGFQDIIDLCADRPARPARQRANIDAAGIGLRV